MRCLNTVNKNKTLIINKQIKSFVIATVKRTAVLLKKSLDKMTLFRITAQRILIQSERLLLSAGNQGKINVPIALKSTEVKEELCAATNLKEILAEKIDKERDMIIKFKKKHGVDPVSQVDVNQIYGGMRSVTCMLWETSLLDPELGIRFRGYSIPELQKLLPKADGGEEPLPEGTLK